MPGFYPQHLEELIRHLGALPGIGPRTAERLALSLLDWDSVQLHRLSELLAGLKNQVTHCRICGNLTDSEHCSICLDPGRNFHVICVVESVKQIPVIHRCGRYDGVFHVLGGKISPLNNISPRDLNISSLFDRVRDTEVTEVIIATSPDIEGEATANYLANELQRHYQVMVSRIAFGVPLGADLTFADAATMGMAISSRRPLR